MPQRSRTTVSARRAHSPACPRGWLLRPARPGAHLPSWAFTTLASLSHRSMATMAPACQVPTKAARSLLGAMLPAARGTSRGRRERQAGHESGVLGDPAPSPPAEVDGRPCPGGRLLLGRVGRCLVFGPHSGWDAGAGRPAPSCDGFTSKTSVFASDPCCPSRSTLKLPSVTPGGSRL